MRYSLQHLLFGVAIAIAVLPARAHAEDWNFALSPYVWLTQSKGETSIGPISADIDMGFDDTLSDLRLAAMLNFRAENGPWAIQVDGVWADLESNFKGNVATADVNTTLWLGSANGRYRVTDKWELFAGVRYFRQDVDIDLLVGPIPASVKATADWLDPVVGARLDTPLSSKWTFTLQGDIGGFGVGSNLSWQAWANFDYRFSETGSLALGWRHLAWDYEEGSGIKEFTYDAYLTGPVVGLTFRF